MADRIKAAVRCVLNDVGQLPLDAHTLDDRSDLYAAGMGSHATVDVMLALEEAFEIEFPTALLGRATFESIASIAAAVAKLEGHGA